MANPTVQTPILASDSFASGAGRTAWSPADDAAADTWTTATGSPTLSVTGGAGTLTGTAALAVMYLSSQKVVNGEIVVAVQASNTADILQVVLRGDVSAANYYFARLSNGNFGIYKRVGGTNTQLATTSVTESASTRYFIRFRVVNSNLYARFWAASGSEPSTWTLNTSDSALVYAGRFGLGATPNNSAHTDSYDTFSMSAILTQFPLGNKHPAGRIQ